MSNPNEHADSQSGFSAPPGSGFHVLQPQIGGEKVAEIWLALNRAIAERTEQWGGDPLNKNERMLYETLSRRIALDSAALGYIVGEAACPNPPKNDKTPEQAGDKAGLPVALGSAGPAFACWSPCLYRGAITCKVCDLHRPNTGDSDDDCDMSCGRIVRQLAFEAGWSARPNNPAQAPGAELS